MKALQLVSPGNLKITNKIPIPKLNNNSLIIKIKYCGICSSDIKFSDKGHRIKKYPVILGHEISGNVYKVGKNIKGYKIGDHVVLGAEVACGKKNCFFCNNNLKIYCENKNSVGTLINGGFAEYIVINKHFVENGPILKISQKIDHKLTCMAESFSCVINGIEYANIKSNNSVIILGSGYMGILFVLLCKRLYNLNNIFVVDLNAKRLKIAKNMGAKEILRGNLCNINTQKRILKLNNNQKFDFVVSANNNIKSHRSAFNFVRNGGFINFFGGVPKGEDDKITLSSNLLHYSQIRVSGTFSSDIRHLKKAVNFILKNKNIIRKLITNIINIDNIVKYFSLVKSNKTIKVLVKL